MALLITLFIMVLLFALCVVVGAMPLWLAVLIFPVEDKSFAKALITTIQSSLASILFGLVWPPLALIPIFLVIRYRYKLNVTEAVIITVVQWCFSWLLLLSFKTFIPMPGISPQQAAPQIKQGHGLRPVTKEELKHP